jgi:hypothetical protein
MKRKKTRTKTNSSSRPAPSSHGARPIESGGSRKLDMEVGFLE